MAEAVLLAGALVIVSQIVFSGWAQGRPVSFLCLPIILWAAFRFDQLAAAICTVVLSILAVRGTLAGSGLFATATTKAC